MVSVRPNTFGPQERAGAGAVEKIDAPSVNARVVVREIKAQPTGLLKQKEPWPEGADASAPLLKVEHVSKSFGQRKPGFLSRKPTFGNRN